MCRMQDTAVEMAKRLLVDSIWKSANLEGLMIKRLLTLWMNFV